MTLTRIQNVLLILLVMLIGVSAAFCISLSLMEYLRIFILGIALALIFAAFPRSFGRSYARKCVLAGAFVFVLYALDPNTNSILKFGSAQGMVSGYRMLSFLILLAAMVLWLLPLVIRKISFRDWRKQFTRTEIYLIAILVSFGIVTMVLELLFVQEGATTMYNSILRGTKIIDCVFLFLLVTHAFDTQGSEGMWRYTVLIISFLIFCAFSSLVGGARAARAYHAARLPRKNTPQAAGTIDTREKLLRVFSLNSREAWNVYEAGYAAGMRDWKTVHARLKATETYPRDTLKESEAQAFLNEKQYAAAIRILETLPLDYRFEGSVTSYLDDITDEIKQGTKDPSLLYLAGLLSMHSSREGESRTFFNEFLSIETNHANAVYFRYHDTRHRALTYPYLQMPARGWLQPVSLEKSVIEASQHITIMYNQYIEGTLWLTPGTYTVSLYARDDGSPRATGFDPTCKMHVWIGSSLCTLAVESTNRQFNSYQFTATVTDVPTDVRIEFTNDMYNETHGWDRNLSVSRLEFRRQR
jgi:hypothetical protein